MADAFFGGGFGCQGGVCECKGLLCETRVFGVDSRGCQGVDSRGCHQRKRSECVM